MDMRGRYKRTKKTNKKSSESRRNFFIRNEAERKVVSNNTKKQWSDPKVRNKMVEAIRKASRRKDLIEKRRKAALKRWADQRFREKVIPLMSGENNHRYIKDRSLVLHRNGRGFLKSQVKKLKKPECEWCGSKNNLQLDHKIPICAGGTSEDENAQTLCVKCNNKKRDSYDLVLMKSYRKRGTSDRVESKTIPCQASRKKREGVCRDYGVAPKGMI